jgi:hypothetical protein
VIALEKLFGEALARFQVGSRLSRTKDAPSAALKLVNDAKSQRKFGADYGEVRLQSCRQRDDRIEAFQVGGEALCLVGDSPISWCAVKRGNPRRLPQFPDQRMLTPATSQNKDFHNYGANQVRS